jgi:hypothetical protein
MGSLQAMDIQNVASSPEQALYWHLTGNHYPPIPVSMIPVCMQAIDAAQEYQYSEDPALLSQELELPEGVLFRDRTTAPVSNIMEAHHLWPFVRSLEEIMEEEDDE